MSRLNQVLSQVLHDLVAKRLWPVAVVLLVALVAIPLTIGRSGSDALVPAPGAPTATSTTPATTTTPAVSDAQPQAHVRVKRRRGGTVDDPFFNPPSTKDAGSSSAAADAGTIARATPPESESASPASPDDTSASSGKASAPSSTSKAPATERRPATLQSTPVASSYLRTVVQVNGAQPHAVSRLTPLGGADDPGLVFLGVARADARYAVFLLGPDAISRGDATCKGDTGCRMIGLKAGQRQLVTIRLAGGAVRRFTVRVRSIRSVSASATRAVMARDRVHADGPRVLRALRRDGEIAAALRTARYDEQAGVLRAVAATSAAR